MSKRSSAQKIREKKNVTQEIKSVMKKKNDIKTRSEHQFAENMKQLQRDEKGE